MRKIVKVSLEKGRVMDNKIFICLLGIAIALPTAMSGAAVPPTAVKEITFKMMDGRKFRVREEVARMSVTINNWLDDFPNENEYVFSKKSRETDRSFARLLPLIKLAFSVKDQPFQERIRKISAAITREWESTVATVEEWQELIDAVNRLDVEALKGPLADSMIKYIYREKSGNREKIEKFISDLPISSEFKGLLAKYWYLNYGKDNDYINLFEKVTKPEPKEVPIDYGFTVQERAAYNKLPSVDRGYLLLSELRLDDLIGLQQIPNIGSVTALILNDNNLTSLQDDIFKGLNKVGYIGLVDNRFTTLSAKPFKGLSNLHSICLAENPLSEEAKASLKAELGDKVDFVTSKSY